MGTGILICGLNGCGKSTLGKVLANALGFHFIDNEDLFFERTDTNAPYTNPRSRDQVEKLLLQQVKEHGNFVFAAVKGDYGEELLPFYSYIVLMEVPKDIRSQRVRNRSFQKFGKRMLAGGDLYAQEERFFQFVDGRTDDYVENWIKMLRCPVIRVDGRKPVEENIALICKQLSCDKD